MNESFSRKTFGEDTYGRHALAEPGGPGDVCHLDYLPKVNLTRMPLHYSPRHALTRTVGDPSPRVCAECGIDLPDDDVAAGAHYDTHGLGNS